jgi:hypothetical protein
MGGAAHAPDELGMRLEAGSDFRAPELRPEVFLRFYLFHCRYRAHPGAVYYVMPYLRDHLGWGPEQALWFAFLNGNTQHPATSLALHRHAPDPSSPRRVAAMVEFFRRNHRRLPFDTDRRHWKTHLPAAVDSYLAALKPHGGSQAAMWASAAQDGFTGVWQQATALYSFGRLSAFSYAEYLRIMGVPFDCDELFLHDRSGSRSHRNGLCIVTGRDAYDWHPSNPDFDGHYPPWLIERLDAEARELVAEARRRAHGEPWADDVGLFTLESALCTYKSWHRPNRRYPNVYNDMLYDRLRAWEARWSGPEGRETTELLWRARRAFLPAYLRLEDSPYDPGCVPVKQNHYRTTGQVIMMDRDDPVFRNAFNDAVAARLYGLRRDLRAPRARRAVQR